MFFLESLIATFYGIQLTPAQMLIIIATATLRSIGTAGVPGAGFVMLSMVLKSVGLPVEGIVLIAEADRIFDIGRTAVNITGDAACAVVVTSLQNKKNNIPYEKSMASNEMRPKPFFLLC